jgi:YtcA family
VTCKRALASLALLCGGCSQAPNIPLFGAYFPAWMLCALLGIVLAIAVRIASIATGLGRASPPLLYPLLAVLFTAAGWILFFRG